MTDRRTIVSGLGWSAFIVYSNRAFSLLTLLVLAKVLEPRDFGIVGIASMIIEVLRIAKDMGLSEALIYQKEESPEAIDTAHTIMIGFGTLLFLIAVVIAPFAARYYSNPTIAPVVIIMASNLIWDAMRAVPRAIYRRRIDFRRLVIPEVVPVLLAAVVSISMALSGFGVWSLVVRTVLTSVLGAVLLKTPGLYRPRLRFHRAHARELFGYGRYVVGTTVLLVVLYNIDKFYVSTVLGLAGLGVFELALRMSELPVKEVSYVIGSVMFPVFSRLDGTTDALKNAFLKTLKYVASVSVPIALVLATFGPALVDQIYGPKWSAIATPLRLLSLYAMFRSLSSIIYDMFKATGNPRLMQRFTIFRLASISVLGLPALHLFGMNGICWLIVGTYAVAFVVEMAAATSLLGLGLFASLSLLIKAAAVPALVIPGVYAVMRTVFVPFTFPDLVLSLIAAGGLYLVSIYCFDRAMLIEVRRLITSRMPA